MASRTQIVCLHEGEQGRSVDPVFINKLIKTLDPAWIRPFRGSNYIRLVDCGGRTSLIRAVPEQVRICAQAGGDTTLMVWADIDDDHSDADSLKHTFWLEAQRQETTRELFDQVVFIFAKDRIENWIEFLQTGSTDESVEGPRVTNRAAADAARELAHRCQKQTAGPALPPSLEWSCKSWRGLVERMR